MKLLDWVRIGLVVAIVLTIIAMFTRNAKADPLQVGNARCSTEYSNAHLANECIGRLGVEIDELNTALATTWRIYQDPATLVTLVPTRDLTWLVNGKNFSMTMYDTIIAAQRAVDPSGTGMPIKLLKGILSNPATFGTLAKLFRTQAVKILKEVGASGSVQSFLEEMRPVIEKPIDPLLAQQGMDWRYNEHCTIVTDAKTCSEMPFYASFKTHYGIEPTEKSVWLMGFLYRKALNHRNLPSIWQAELKLAIDELGK